MSVLILGATSPIARALSHQYAQAGHAVLVAARDAEEAERIASDLRVRHRTHAFSQTFDALDFSSHQTLIDQAIDALGPIDIAVIAFGHMGIPQNGGSGFEEVHRVIDTNYTGAVSICEILARHMTQQSRGSIIGLSSVAGDRGRASNAVYGSAKGALTLYLQGLRNRLFKAGVHVMTVKLGFVDTRMTFGMQTAIPVAAPEKVAQAIFHAQQARINSFYYPRFWRPIMSLIKAIPEIIFKRMSL